MRENVGVTDGDRDAVSDLDDVNDVDDVFVEVFV